MPVEMESSDVSIGRLLEMKIGSLSKTTAARDGPFFFAVSVELSSSLGFWRWRGGMQRGGGGQRA
jgi:hypothetical protein